MWEEKKNELNGPYRRKIAVENSISNLNTQKLVNRIHFGNDIDLLFCLS